MAVCDGGGMMVMMMTMSVMMLTEQAGTDGGLRGWHCVGDGGAGGRQVGHVAHLPDSASSHEAVQIPQHQVSPQGQYLIAIFSYLAHTGSK